MLCPDPDCRCKMIRVKGGYACTVCGEVVEPTPTNVRDARRLADGFALLNADEDPSVDTDRHIGR